MIKIDAPHWGKRETVILASLVSVGALLTSCGAPQPSPQDKLVPTPAIATPAPTPVFDVNKCIDYQDPLRGLTGEVNRGKCLLEELLQVPIGFYNQSVFNGFQEAMGDPAKLVTKDYKLATISRWYYLDINDVEKKQQAQEKLDKMITSYRTFQSDKNYLTLEDIQAYLDYLKTGKFKIPELKTIDTLSYSAYFAGILNDNIIENPHDFTYQHDLFNSIATWTPRSGFAQFTNDIDSINPTLIYLGSSQK
jgi:hypothetical protein